MRVPLAHAGRCRQGHFRLASVAAGNGRRWVVRVWGFGGHWASLGFVWSSLWEASVLLGKFGVAVSRLRMETLARESKLGRAIALA